MRALNIDVINTLLRSNVVNTIGLFNIRENIEEAIQAWLEGAVETFINFLNSVLFNYENLAGYARDAYNLMVLVGGILIVALCLGKIITQILDEGQGSQQANIWFTIEQSIKGSALLIIMPVTIAFSMNSVVLPIGNYMLDNLSEIGVTGIQNMMESEGFQEVFNNVMGVILTWLFMAVVIGFFCFKVILAQGNLLMNEILSPLVAVSIVTDKYNFVEDWWKDILMHCVTIVVLTISMVLFAEALSMTAEGGAVMQVPALIASGGLVITGPTLVKKIWYKSGIGRSGSALAMKALMLRK